MNWFEEYKKSLKMAEVEEVIDLVFYRPLAFLLVISVYKTKIKPDHLTIAAIGMGLMGGFFYSLGTYSGCVLGALFYLLFNILDCSDGQLARLKKNGTSVGRITSAPTALPIPRGLADAAAAFARGERDAGMLSALARDAWPPRGRARSTTSTSPTPTPARPRAGEATGERALLALAIRRGRRGSSTTWSWARTRAPSSGGPRERRTANEGVFVVLEGIDGSGTTTQAERCAAHLRAERRLVHVTHEPSTGPIGAQIRLVLTGSGYSCPRPTRPRRWPCSSPPTGSTTSTPRSTRCSATGTWWSPTATTCRASPTSRSPPRRDPAATRAPASTRQRETAADAWSLDPQPQPLRPPARRHGGARRHPRGGRRAAPGPRGRGRDLRRRRPPGPPRRRLPAAPKSSSPATG